MSLLEDLAHLGSALRKHRRLTWAGTLNSLPLPSRRLHTHRACRLLIRPSMSRCPAEYCSMTSFTSYGRSVSLNFLLATRNFRILLEEGESLAVALVPAGDTFPIPSLPLCPDPGHLLGPLQTTSAGSPASLPNHQAPLCPAYPQTGLVSLICLPLQPH